MVISLKTYNDQEHNDKPRENEPKIINGIKRIETKKGT